MTSLIQGPSGSTDTSTSSEDRESTEYVEAKEIIKGIADLRTVVIMQRRKSRL
jgi:hypothetical protein